MAKRAIPCPTEANDQIALFRFAAMQSGKYPELLLMTASANGGSRHPAEAARLKQQGVRAGVSDIQLPVARGGYIGLWVELKRQFGGRVSEEQQWWIDRMNEQGHYAVVCRGFDDARDTILRYLTGGIRKKEDA